MVTKYQTLEVGEETKLLKILIFEIAYVVQLTSKNLKSGSFFLASHAPRNYATAQGVTKWHPKYA